MRAPNIINKNVVKQTNKNLPNWVDVEYYPEIIRDLPTHSANVLRYILTQKELRG